MFYLIEVRDSDGNHCGVTDYIIESLDRERASKKLWEYLAGIYPDDENDGFFGTYHTCDCSCEHSTTKVCDDCSNTWECSHGGLTTNEDYGKEHGPQEFTTYNAARRSHAPYHELVEILEGE